MKVTGEMIAAAVNASTLGDEGSYVFDYIREPDASDPDWKAVGGRPDFRLASEVWRDHIAQRMLEAALERVGALDK